MKNEFEEAEKNPYRNETLDTLTTGNNKSIYYHTFSKKMNSIEEETNKNDDCYSGNPNCKDSGGSNSYLYNIKANTDSFNEVGKIAQNNLEKNKILNPYQDLNQNNYCSYSNNLRSNRIIDPRKRNIIIIPENNINDESLYQNNLNQHEVQPNQNLNIKEKLINNLTNPSNNIIPGFNGKSKIKELSTLQSNEFRYGDSINYNDLSARISQGAIDKSPRFIQSLDSEIAFDYLKRLEKQTAQVYSTINSNEIINTVFFQ